jgi:Flp pilus assembly protein TadD
MKILFLTHPYPNYVPDLLLHGLRKLLGGDVIDWPRKDCVYDGVLGLGVCPPDQLAPGWFPGDAGVDRNDIERKLAAGYFDVLVTDLRAFTTFNALYPTARIRGAAIIDGEDVPPQVDPGPCLLFRREHYGDDRAVPLPMALPEEIFARISAHDAEPKRYPIGFVGSAGGATSARRAVVSELVRAVPDGLWLVSDIASPDNPVPAQRLGREAYYRAMQSCQMVLSLRGAGWDTFRFWEHAACHAVHVAEAMPLTIPDAFQPSRQLLEFRTPHELLHHVEALRAGRLDTAALRAAGREHLRCHHLTTHRAQYFIDRLKRAFNIEDPIMTQNGTSVIDELKHGMRLQEAGDLLGAEACYRRILDSNPDHPDALHLLGVIGYQIGDLDVALDLIQRAIAQNANIADYHNNLGEVCRARGATAAAQQCYEQALRLDPTHIKARNNLAKVLVPVAAAG